MAKILAKDGEVLLNTDNYKFTIGNKAHSENVFVVIAHNDYAKGLGQSVTICEGTGGYCQRYLRRLAHADGAVEYSDCQSEFVKVPPTAKMPAG